MNKLTPFSYASSIKSATEKVLNNYGSFFLLMLIWSGFFGITGFSLIAVYAKYMIPHLGNQLTDTLAPQPLVKSLVVSAVMILGYLIGPYVRYQILSLGAALDRNESIGIFKAFSLKLSTFFRLYAAWLYLMLKVILGSIIFIIPGYYLYLKNYFAGFTLIEDPTRSIHDDMLVSHKITTGVKWRLLLVYYVEACIVVLVPLLTVLSLVMPPVFLITTFLVPVMILTNQEIYKQLKKTRIP